MKAKAIQLADYQNEPLIMERHPGNRVKLDLLAEKRAAYLNEFNLFIAYFSIIPNFIDELHIDCRKANSWFLDSYGDEIRDCYFDKRFIDGKQTAEYDDIFYFLYDDLMVYFDTNCSRVKYLFRRTETDKVEEIISGIKRFKERKARFRPEISLLIASRDGVETRSLTVTKPRVSIADNYNDDFGEVHQAILRRLSRKNDKGIVLLHGRPGTGKTSYIRYLISSVRKNVIFLPPNMAGAITNPDLVSVLVHNTNSILVIEDAENIVADRERDGHSPVSALLNISDGLLSDFLNIQVVCSFNTDIARIDSALIRKGRLIADYEFKELDIPKAQALSDKLGYKARVTAPMSLAAIYNQDEKDFRMKPRDGTIGFRPMR
jgi:hypothetical protein